MLGELEELVNQNGDQSSQEVAKDARALFCKLSEYVREWLSGKREETPVSPTLATYTSQSSRVGTRTTLQTAGEEKGVKKLSTVKLYLGMLLRFLLFAVDFGSAMNWVAVTCSDNLITIACRFVVELTFAHLKTFHSSFSFFWPDISKSQGSRP